MKLRFLIAFSLLAITYFLTACDKEKFKPDRNDKRLPKYTEKGNQVAGALINDVAWKSNFRYGFAAPPSGDLKITNFSKGDSLQIHLDGILMDGPNKDKPVDILIYIKNFQVKDILSVPVLDGKVFFLDGKNNYAVIDDLYRVIVPGKLEIKPGKGEFHFKRVQIRENITHNTGTQSYHPYIISGTFNFEFDNGGNKINVEKGRFDFKFYADNLRSLE